MAEAFDSMGDSGRMGVRLPLVVVVCAALGLSSAGAIDPAQDVWCALDFDAPHVVGGRVVLQDLPARGRARGRFGAGYHFKGSGRRDVFVFDNSAVLQTFPVTNGSFAAWIKKPGGYAGVWGRHTKWGNNWGFETSNFRTASRCSLNPNGTYEKFPAAQEAFLSSNRWMHVAATWSADGIVVYADGRRVMQRPGARVVFDPLADEPSRLFVGGYGVGSGRTDVVVDEFFIFNRALSEGEVGALASADAPLRRNGVEVLTSPVDFAVYRRDETSAALRFVASVHRTVAADATWQIADLPPATRTISLTKGTVPLRLAFDAYKLSPGTYPWSYTLKCGGRVVATDSGTLQILPTSQDGGWTFLSWGGAKPVSSAFMHRIGMNTYNLAEVPDMRRKASEGFYVNPRVEIPRRRKGAGLDMCGYEEIRDETRDLLLPLAGSGLWRTTLVNSEVYPTPMDEALANPRFRKDAMAALGHAPDGRVSKLGEMRNGWRAAGVFAETNETFRTQKWFDASGMPAYRQNAAMAEAIHLLAADNVVWSEPVFQPGGLGAGVDMCADWLYEYFTTRTLVDMRKMYGRTRQHGKAFMPTLGMCYYPSQGGEHPTLVDAKTGKPRRVRVTQSADELMIKSWMAIGSVRADALSMYEADAWEYGVSNALKYAANPQDESVYSIAETDAPSRYGRFVREVLHPAALLLKGVENVHPRVAMLAMSETGYCCGHGYGRGYCEGMLGQCLAEAGVDFDIVCDGEMSAESLARYDYLVWFMAAAVTESHDAALRAAAEKGTKIVLDAEGAWAKGRYPGAIELTNRYVHVWRNPDATKVPFNAWLATVRDSIRGRQPVMSDSDGQGAWTFAKKHAGAVYAVVVNDFRREGGSILNTFKTDPNYRPCGTPHEIATTFRLPSGAAVYAFNSGRGALPLRDGVYRAEYGPAEGKVFCVYPRPLKAIEATLTGRPARAAACVLSVRLTDVSGKPAPGRQIVRLVLLDSSGEAYDVPALQTLERGEGKIPLRFARDVRLGTWTWRLDDLTAGLQAEGRFEVAPETGL